MNVLTETDSGLLALSQREADGLSTLGAEGLELVTQPELSFGDYYTPSWYVPGWV